MKQNPENLMVDVPKEEREEMLKSMASKTQIEPVRHHYSEDEKAQMKDYVSSESIIVMDQEEEFAAIRKEFNTAIKKHKEGVIDALVNLKKGYSENEERVFLFDDQENGKMNIYDRFGEFLYSRKLFPDERQTTIIDMAKTGTHG